jgi:hypothetical protein
VTPRYALDIETTGLCWDSARITTFAVHGDGITAVYESSDEAQLLAQLRGLLASLAPGTVLTWNGAVFDGPFIAGRSRELGLGEWFDLVPDLSITPKYEPQPGYEAIGLHPVFPASSGAKHNHVDVAYGYWCSWAAEHGVHWGLKPVATAAGVDVIEVDRASMDDLTPPERMAYCLSDVVATYRLDEIARADNRLEKVSSKCPD